MAQEQQEVTGSLEKRGIAVETQIDPQILQPGQAKSVRFRLAKPAGYAFSEVDDFVQNIVIPSLQWYVQTLHQRDRAIHTLGADLDKSETDIKNLKSQIQYLEYNTQIKEGISRNDDDKEMAALLGRLKEAEDEIARLRAGGAVEGDAVDTAELDAYIEEITEQYNNLLERYTTDTADLQRQLDEAQAAAAAALVSASTSPASSEPDEETLAYIAQITAQYEALNKQYEEDTLALRAEVDAKSRELAEAVAASASAVPAPAVDTSELEAYIAQITEQYTELVKRYEDDTTALQSEVDRLGGELAAAQQALTEAQASTPAAPVDTSELEAYIEQIRNQYLELSRRYEEDILNVGSAEDFAALESENATLKARVAELQARLGEEEVKPEPPTEKRGGLILPTEEKTRAIDTSRYSDLPPGIRPDDLE